MVFVRAAWTHDNRHAAAREIHHLIAAALAEIGDNCLEEANRIIPLEEGIMQDSGFVEVDDTTLEAQVAYSTPYTVKQHEDPDLKHDEGRVDHWLEKTVNANQSRYEAHMAAATHTEH